ncbi:DUF99 family protein [Haloarchaeobius litoreus]|uniref:UPF0215 protein ACFSBL_15575 n=1 Tax=Haloarchaeobius litoreus TaxID=755306 RepID=A0ABD6DMX4_9EURY|nr:DUF99 family protein [Haloarchaeobius litoreus]
MKTGVRAVGIAESTQGNVSTLAGVVVRADRTVDGLSFATCTVGGSDATDAVVETFERLGREDVRYVVLAGIALAWYNVVDLRAVADAVDRPVLSVTFEASPGLEPAIEEAFDGEERERRLALYRRQPPRTPVEVNGETVYVRAVGVDDSEARDVVRAFTPEGGRPEPLRVARFAARAGDALRRAE